MRWTSSSLIDSLTSSDYAGLLPELIRRFRATGLCVRLLITDGLSKNLLARCFSWGRRGTLWFFVDGIRVYHATDVPHILKYPKRSPKVQSEARRLIYRPNSIPHSLRTNGYARRSEGQPDALALQPQRAPEDVSHSQRSFPIAA